MRKEEKIAQSRKEDAVLNKVFVWFFAAVILEFLLFLVNRFYINVRVATDWGVPVMNAFYQVIRVLPFAGVIAAALFAIRAVTWKKQNKPAEKLAVACVLSLVVALCALIIWKFYDTGVKFLYVFVPVVAVLALFYYLYQREFFFSALMCAMGGSGLWAVRKGGMAGHAVLMYVALVITIVIAILIIAVACKAKKNNGTVVVSGKERKAFSGKTNYLLLILSGVITCVFFAAGMFLGSAVSYYLLMVLVAWLVVLLVYHTVKLM